MGVPTLSRLPFSLSMIASVSATGSHQSNWLLSMPLARLAEPPKNRGFVLDQGEFLNSTPTLELTFTLECYWYYQRSFKVNEAPARMIARKLNSLRSTMLSKPDS